MENGNSGESPAGGNRRREITAFLLIAAGLAAAVHTGILHIPYLISFPFLGVIIAMGSELSYDIVHAADTSHQLRESETRFRTVTDAAPVMIWMSDINKHYTFYNKGWLDFTGHSVEQELPLGWTHHVHSDDRDQCTQLYADAFDVRRDFTLECRLRRKDGEYRWILAGGVPRYDSNGSFQGYIGSCIDITNNKRADLELQQHRNELAHLSRITMMGELSGSMAHELNQPLTAILSRARPHSDIWPGTPLISRSSAEFSATSYKPTSTPEK